MCTAYQVQVMLLQELSDTVGTKGVTDATIVLTPALRK
jgi:hypothetical protein